MLLRVLVLLSLLALASQDDAESEIVFPSSASATKSSKVPKPSVSASSTPARTCPPLLSSLLDLACHAPGRERPQPCGQAQPLGTVASFDCKPLFERRSLPDGARFSRCEADGTWSRPLFACTPVCGRPTGKGVAFVRNGQNVSSAVEFPWHVVVYNKTETAPEQICGGSLVSPKFFVSAAHCFEDENGQLRPPTAFVSAVGKRFRDLNVVEGTEQRIELKQIIVKDYGGFRLLYANDIALVELQGEVTITATVMPICVDWKRARPPLRGGDEGIVVGFGGSGNLEALQFSRLPFIDLEVCKGQVPDRLLVYTALKDKFCVGVSNGSSVGKGDSGGGLAFATPDRQWFLEGIVSIGDARRAAVSLFTKVSLYVPWISSGIRDQEPVDIQETCGKPPPGPSELLQDGDSALGDSLPWHAAVYHREQNVTRFVCGGSLISRCLVLTAAHCVLLSGPLQPQKVSVALGKYLSDWQSEDGPNVMKTDVKAVHTHPSYSGAGARYSFDIAVLELETCADISATVYPVCLDDGFKPTTGKTIKIAGWGGGRKALAELESVLLKQLDRPDCLASFNATDRYRLYVTPDKFCARSREGSHHSGLAKGDSGGGAHVKRDGVWYVAGIVSVGLGDRDNYLFGLVDVAQYVPWVKRVTKL
ncbi:polyserase-2-like [Thrips palmi]|uniref:Polyserase-2-like n=1 Tax=Thrips palmi TaxID=161013 RepID=A0A6P8Z8P2_THRPL|nr:polyserase-2-like [Thrips palmi]